MLLVLFFLHSIAAKISTRAPVFVYHRPGEARDTMTDSSPLTKRPAWRALQAHREALEGFHLREAFAKDPERFVNARAEMFWGFREKLEWGELDLDPEDEDLRNQMHSIKFKFDSKGRIGIEKKDEMKKRGLPSPNHLDAAVIAAFDYKPPGKKRAGTWGRQVK